MVVTLTAAGTLDLDQRTSLERLLAEARSGDRAALDRFLAAIQVRVFTFAYRLTGDHAAAEDVAQETLFRICCNVHRYRPGTNLWGWIYRITVRLACDARRRNRELLPLDEAEHGGAQDDLERREKMRHVLGALDTLTEKERTAIVLIDMEGMTCREAAQVMGCLQITARTRAAYARRKLRNALLARYPELEELL